MFHRFPKNTSSGERRTPRAPLLQPGELYMNLERLAADTQQKIDYRVSNGAYQVGVLRGPDLLVNKDVSRVTSEEFRSRFREILHSLDGRVTGYLIMDENEPITSLMSTEMHNEMILEAREFFKWYFRRQEKKERRERIKAKVLGFFRLKRT